MPGTERNACAASSFISLREDFIFISKWFPFPSGCWSIAPSLGQWMPLTQLLPPSIALKLPTIIRNPQGATKLREGKGRVPPPTSQTDLGGGMGEKEWEKAKALQREERERNVISGICCASKEEGSVTFLIIINTWRQICQHCSSSLELWGRGANAAAAQTTNPPPPFDGLSIAAAFPSPSNRSPPHHSPPLPWSLHRALPLPPPPLFLSTPPQPDSLFSTEFLI